MPSLITRSVLNFQASDILFMHPPPIGIGGGIVFALCVSECVLRASVRPGVRPEKFVSNGRNFIKLWLMAYS